MKMANFIHFLNKARLTLFPAMGSVVMPQPIKGLRENKVDEYLDSFNDEFSEQFQMLNNDQKLTFRAMIFDADFNQQYLAADNKTSFLLTSFQHQFTDFSPLHPAYPMINTFIDVNTNLSGIQADEFTTQEKLLTHVEIIIA